MGSFTARTKAFFKRKKKSKAVAATPEENPMSTEPAQVVIVGAGIVGLVLALALQTHCGLQVELYERAEAFHDDVGAGMGMYPNGLRVIRDISPELLQQIREAGFPYSFRRWERHDGTEVAVAEEKVLTEGEEDLQTIGIRRWKLQKVLFEAVVAAGMKVHFNKHLEGIKHVDDDITLRFTDGSHRITKLLLACDGSKSRVRDIVSKHGSKLTFNGVTCLMGTSTVPRDAPGISLPSSETTKCHGAFFPTGPTEQCFQFHFPANEEEAKASIGAWGTLTEAVCQEECNTLAARLKEEGWDEKFVTPLYHVDKAIKVSFSTLEPHLDYFVYGRIVLVGDAGHPPVPYLGQGAQQGLEDAGTLALLLKEICCMPEVNETDDGQKKQHDAVTFSLARVDTALKLYNQLRVPRTKEIVDHSKTWGNMQQKRADNKKYNAVKEEKIQRDVFFHETMPVLFHGAKHDYRSQVEQALEEEPLLPVPEVDVVC